MVVAYTGHGNVPRTRFLSCSELGRSLSLQLPPQLGAISKPGAKRIREGIYNHPVQRVEVVAARAQSLLHVAAP